MSHQSALLVAALSVITLGCQPAIHWPDARLANVIPSATGKRGTPIPIEAYLISTDGCKRQTMLTATVDEARRVVTLQGRLSHSEREVCPGIVSYHKTSTTFTPQNTGKYTFTATIVPNPQAGSYDHIQPPIDPTLATATPINLTVEVTE